MAVLLEFKHRWNDVWKAVRDGGDGTIAVVALGLPDLNDPHAVVVVNRDNRVYLLEAQPDRHRNPPEILDSLAAVRRRYGNSEAISYDIVPAQSR